MRAGLCRKDQQLYKQRHGTLLTEKDQMVKQHFKRWLEILKTKIRWSTYLGYHSIFKKHILPTLGHISLKRLRALDIDALYARKHREGYVPGTIEFIHMALKQAVCWRLVARNVSEDVSPPHETQPQERQILTREQAQKLLTATKGHSLAAMLTLVLAMSSLHS
jgi:hypothetical protein